MSVTIEPLTRNITLAEIPANYCLKTAKPSLDHRQLRDRYCKLEDLCRNHYPLERLEVARIAEELPGLKLELADAIGDRIDPGFLSLSRRQEKLKFSSSSTYDCYVPRFAVFRLDSNTCKFGVTVTRNAYHYSSGIKSVVEIEVSGELLREPFSIWNGFWNLPERRQPDSLIQSWLTEDIYRLQEARLHRHVLEQSCLAACLDYFVGSVSDPAVVATRARIKDRYFLPRQIDEYTFSTTFTGAIPSATRKQIPLWQRVFDELIVVAEAGDWLVDTRRVASGRDPDPLVLGRLGKNWWLLDRFDTTSAEEYVSREWTY